MCKPSVTAVLSNAPVMIWSPVGKTAMMGMKKFDGKFSLFDTIAYANVTETGRQTDGRTPHGRKDRAMHSVAR